MKKTKYITLTSCALDGSRAKWQRVFVDEDGKRYIRSKGGYLCIEALPCVEHITRDWR